MSVYSDHLSSRAGLIQLLPSRAPSFSVFSMIVEDSERLPIVGDSLGLVRGGRRMPQQAENHVKPVAVSSVPSGQQTKQASSSAVSLPHCRLTHPSLTAAPWLGCIQG